MYIDVMSGGVGSNLFIGLFIISHFIALYKEHYFHFIITSEEE